MNNREELRERYNAEFQPFYQGHLRGFAIALAGVVLFGFGLYSLDMTYARLVGGLGELGRIEVKI